MQLSPTELIRRTPSLMYRTTPARLTLPVAPAVTRDGHALHGDVQVSVALVARDADRELFDEQFPGPLVTLDTVRQHLAPRLADAARAFAQQHDAQQCLGQRATFAELILARLNEIGFACGLEFLPPIDVTLACPSVEAERAATRASAQRLDALGRAADVMAKVKTGDIDALPPRERGTALQILLSQSAPQPAYAVAGPHLLRIDAGDAPPQKVPLDADLGPLRSVRRATLDGAACVLIGGQRGVALLRDPAAPPAIFPLLTSSDRGFNSAAVDAVTRTLYAAHSEIGIARWTLDDAEPLAPLETPAGARWLTALDERIVIAAGGSLCVLDAAGVRVAAGGDEPIVGLHVLAGAIVVVRQAGTIQQLDRATLRPMSTAHRGTRIVCSAAVTAGGLDALAVAGEDGPIDVVSPDGELLFELHGLPGVRMIAAAGNAIFAVTADRARVAVWHADQLEKPMRIHAITALVQNRVADLA